MRLQYSFEREGQRGADMHNPLFELLSAIADAGSIQHAAFALGASYRHVWGSCKQWESVLGEPLLVWSKGQPARLTPFAERLLWAEKRARLRLVPHIEALRIELERVLAEALDGEQLPMRIHASHDLALPLLRDQASAAGLHVDLRFAGSLDALRALADGRCTVAGFHVPPLAHERKLFAQGLKPLLAPGRHKLIGCMRRWQGLLVARGNPLALRDMADVAARRARFVNRQSGSGTRLLAEHLLAEAGLAPASIAGFADCVEDSHLAAAAAVAAGAADAALGVVAAAASFELDAVPLVEEEYFLVCLADALEAPPVQRLRQVLGQPDWAARLRALPGYSAAQPGEVLSLTRALPWWRFRSPRKRAAQAPPAGATQRG